MLTPFGKLPIRKKLTRIIFGVSMLILTVSIIAVFFIQWHSYKENTLIEIKSLAQVIGENSSAGIVFNDPVSLGKNLQSLERKGNIISAKILTPEFDTIASHSKSTNKNSEGNHIVNKGLAVLGHKWGKGSLEILEPIFLDQEKIGYFYIKSSMSDLYQRLLTSAFYLFIVLCVGLIISSILAKKLQLIITAPISHLATIIQQVSEEKNYSLRADDSTFDEMGQLAAGFNVMIEKIQTRDAHLESLVQKRTEGLKRATDEALALAKKANEANEAKSKFLATMSHEIRTPLNGIVGILELLTRSKLSEEQLRYINLLSKSSDWLMRVINDVLDYSKIEAGELILENTPFNPKETIENLAGLYRAQAEKKEIGFRLSLSPDLPQCLAGDQFRLNQILGNLISNAIKFTDKGFIEIIASSSLQSQSRAVLQIIVTDTGIGIPQADQEKIFDPFQQGNLKTARKAGGTGLGLSISSKLVKIMSGSFRIEDNLPQGTKFFIEIPFEITDRALVKTQTETPSAMGQVWRKQPAVLLVDDNEINREVNKDILEQLGCRVILAEDGQEALEKLADVAADLVLMDCEMPVLDGYEASRRIRRIESSENPAKHLPIIALTAHVTQKDKQMCLDAGMDDYLGKPFRKKMLEDKLHFWLQDLSSGQQGPTDEAIESYTVAANRDEPTVAVRSTLHDLRNTLSGIIGYAEMGRRKQDEDSANLKYFQSILNSAERATEILVNINHTELQAKKNKGERSQ